MNKLFVYGTLMEGYLANMMLETSTFIASGITEQPFIMKTNGVFPMVTETGNDGRYAGNVMGEVYEVNDDVLKIIDEYENVPTLFTRKEVTISTCKNESITGWMYVHNDDQVTPHRHIEYIHPFKHFLYRNHPSNHILCWQNELRRNVDL